MFTNATVYPAPEISDLETSENETFDLETPELEMSVSLCDKLSFVVVNRRLWQRRSLTSERVDLFFEEKKIDRLTMEENFF